MGIGARRRFRHKSAATQLPKTPNADQIEFQKPPSLLITIFIISLILPIITYIGPLRLSPYRIVIIIIFIPYFISWISGKFDGIRLPDILILLTSLWGATALMVTTDFDLAIEPAGILLIETFGSYLLARGLIRRQQDFERMVQTLLWTVVFFVPFAALEALTGRSYPLEALRFIFNVISDNDIGTRLNLYRVQVLFEHPILYGAFCASAIGLTFYVIGFGKSIIGKIPTTSTVIMAAFFSLSTGPFAAIVTQLLIIGWDYITKNIKNRWRILTGIFVFAYITVDFISNRSPFHVIVTYLSFNTGSAYNRILIWNFGSAEVLRHPFFGIGFNEWVRPAWMSASMDNFWLVIAVRYGLPAFLTLATALLIIMFAIGGTRLRNERLAAHRSGILVSLVGLIVAGSTVHYWNAIYSWFMFLVGSGLWMLKDDYIQLEKPADDETKQTTRHARRMERQRNSNTRRRTSKNYLW